MEPKKFQIITLKLMKIIIKRMNRNVNRVLILNDLIVNLAHRVNLWWQSVFIIKSRAKKVIVHFVTS